VHVNDPAVREYTDLDDLPTHTMLEIRRFFEDYKVLEGKPVAVGGTLSRAQALGLVREGVTRYRQSFPKK
jgi:inorganic pyrophosphatase